MLISTSVAALRAVVRACACAAMVAAVVAAAPPAQPATHLPPPPPAAALAKSAKIIREIYSADYRDTSALGRRNLARKMMADTAGTENDPAGRFALLCEARDQAAAAGDAQTAVMAIDALGRSFAIDISEMTEVLIAVKPTPGVDNSAVIVEFGLRSLAPLVQEGHNDLATKLIALIHAASSKSHDPSLQAAAKGAIAWAQLAIGEAEKVKASIEKLKVDPADGPANAAVGKFYCLYRGDWTRGLAALANGNDPQLQALAKKDLANPSAAGDCRAVADGWWEVGETLPAPIKPAARARAAIWYRRGLAQGLTGLAKALAERRIADAGPAPMPAQISAPPKAPKSAMDALGEGQFTKPWPAASSKTYLKAISTNGESIAQGKALEYEGAAIKVDVDNASIRVRVDGWDLHFAPPRGKFLKTGEYPDVMRYPFNRESPGLSFIGHGHGANAVNGKFVIWELVTQHGRIVRLAVDFIHRSEGNDAPLYGMLRYNSTLE